LSQQASSLQPPKDYADAKQNNDNVRLLYQRDPNRNTIVKASFLMSSLNSIYWLWYVVDFVPAVNASPIDNFHIDPIYGFGGLGLSVLIQSAFTLYPLSLVSKIGHRTTPSSSISDLGNGIQKKRSTLQQQQEVLVWKHTLPLFRTSSKPQIIPLGGITLDKASDNVRVILEDLGGNIGKFEGHLGLKRVSNKETKNDGSNSSSLTEKFPIILDIRSPSEIHESELMLQTLLSGKFKNHSNTDSERTASAEESVTRDRNKFHHRRSKHQKGKRNRGKK
jgi:hypothetical protein